MNQSSLSVPVGVSSKWTLVTPEMAISVLEKNGDNRPLDQGTVEAYERMILSGEWVATHQGIAIAADGRLIDGQHRLWAIVNTRVAVYMLVTEGLPFASIVAVDGNKVRSASQTDKILDKQNGMSHRETAIISVLLTLHAGKHEHVKYGLAELRAARERYRESIAWATSFNRVHGPAAVFGAFAFIHSIPSARAKAVEFVELYTTGANIPAGSPVLTLTRGMSGTTDYGSSKRWSAVLKTLRCVHAFCVGEELLRAYATVAGKDYFLALRRATPVGRAA